LATAFDTLKFSSNLESSGIPKQQATAMAESLSVVLDEMRNEMVTRDFVETRFELQEERNAHRFRYIAFTQAVIVAAVLVPHVRVLLGN
jgi:hypothetical protein